MGNHKKLGDEGGHVCGGLMMLKTGCEYWECGVQVRKLLEEALVLHGLCGPSVM